MAFVRVAMTIAADHWRICQISPPLIKHEAIIAFGQELGRLPLNGQYVVCTTVEESQTMCDFLANDTRIPGIYGLDAEFMNDHMSWNHWDKNEAGPLANLAKKKLDIALHGQQYAKRPFAIIIQVCRANGHTVIFDLLEMGVVPISLIELLKGAHGIIRFAASCDLTAMTNVDIRFTDVKIRADTNQIHLFLKSNRSMDYVREMKPDLYKHVINRTFNFCHAGNSSAAIVHHLFGVHLEKGFQGQGLAWVKRPLPS
uniref:Uncharacterized protein n=1 Tax=Romanomermis culicivorax TaxID=13658 RepID=A0A915KNH9_ROMCU